MPNSVFQQTPDILLLGGGYVLSALASALPRHRFLITATSAEKVESFRRKGYTAEVFRIEEETKQDLLRARYPRLQYCIDSIPPLLDIPHSHDRRKLLAPLFPSDCHPRFLYLSTTGVYGGQHGEWVDEESVCQPFSDTAYARCKTEESYLQSEDPSHIFRLSGIYGPGRGLSYSLREGKYRVVQDDEKYTNRIHLSDICSALLSAIERIDQNLTFSTILNLSDDEPAQQRDVVDYYIKTFQLPHPQEISKAEAMQQARHRLLLNQRVRNERLHRELLPHLEFPSYREGASTEGEVKADTFSPQR